MVGKGLRSLLLRKAWLMFFVVVVFFFFWLSWVFILAQAFFSCSKWELFLLWSMGSRVCGLSSCAAWA